MTGPVRYGDNEQARNQALGWLVYRIGRARLLQEATQAEVGGHPETAEQFREWAERLTDEEATS